MIDTDRIVEEVIEYFRQEIFPDESAVIMYKLKHRYMPRLSHKILQDCEKSSLDRPNYIHVPYSVMGELKHAAGLISTCWDLIFTLEGLPFYSDGRKAFLYRDVLFLRTCRRRIDYVPAGKWRELFNKYD